MQGQNLALKASLFGATYLHDKYEYKCTNWKAPGTGQQTTMNYKPILGVTHPLKALERYYESIPMGVYRDTTAKSNLPPKYTVEVEFPIESGIHHFVGRYESEEEAIYAYRKVRQEVWC